MLLIIEQNMAVGNDPHFTITHARLQATPSFHPCSFTAMRIQQGGIFELGSLFNSPNNRYRFRYRNIVWLNIQRTVFFTETAIFLHSSFIIQGSRIDHKPSNCTSYFCNSVHKPHMYDSMAVHVHTFHIFFSTDSVS